MKPLTIKIAVVTLATTWLSAAHAENILTNGSFEQHGAIGSSDVVIAAGDTNFFPGWTVLTSGAEYVQPNQYQNWGVAPDGVTVVDLSAGALGGGIAQSFPTVAGSAYSVRFWFGTLEHQGRSGNATVQITAGDTSTNFSTSTHSPFLVGLRLGFSFTATNAVTTLSFSTTDPDGASFVVIDDVGVFGTTTNSPVTLTLDLYPGIQISGDVGQSYRVDYAERLSPSTWIPLAYITLPTSPYLFFDTSSPRSTNRFYRAEHIIGPP